MIQVVTREQSSHNWKSASRRGDRGEAFICDEYHKLGIALTHSIGYAPEWDFEIEPNHKHIEVKYCSKYPTTHNYIIEFQTGRVDREDLQDSGIRVTTADYWIITNCDTYICVPTECIYELINTYYYKEVLTHGDQEDGGISNNRCYLIPCEHIDKYAIPLKDTIN